MDYKIKAVLFDLVGTLIYVKDPVGYVYSNSALMFGYKTDYMKLDKAFYEVLKSKQTPRGGSIEEKKWWKDVVYETFKSAGYDLKEKFDELFEYLFKEFTRKSAWAVYPDVIPTLGKLSVRKGIISNFDSRLEIILEELELRNYFHCLAYSGKVGFSKPDPRIFQYALNELNILPEEAIYVGDSLNIDYYPGKELNMNVLLVNRGQTTLDKGIKTISNLNEILNYF